MSSSQPEPSAEEIKDRTDKLGEQEDQGTGNEDPDPATAENPPTDRSAGETKRSQGDK